MKNFIVGILLIFSLSGCNDTFDAIGEKWYSDLKFYELCQNYDLAICGDIEAPPYSPTTMEEIQLYAYDNFRYGVDFIYEFDDGEEYDYLYGYPMEGDCEDYVITLLENLILLGMVDVGEAEWQFGDTSTGLHAWLLITKNGETFIFDTWYPYGSDYSVVDTHDYWFTVYKY